MGLNSISGMQTKEKFAYEKPTGGYRAYVLVELNKSAVQAEMLSQIKNEESMYADFKASQAFQALEAELAE